MSELTKLIGQRIRSYRTRLGLSQERLAELSGCHPTYIGQIERGEKNATVESIEKITSAMELPLSRLFEKIDERDNTAANIPLMCYEMLAAKSEREQKQLYSILVEIINYKNK